MASAKECSPERSGANGVILTNSSPNNYPADIDLLLLGKTGNGKSAAGNSILGITVFEESEGAVSKTSTMKWAMGRHRRQTVKVVDGPGVGDTRRSEREREEQMHAWLNHAIKMNDRGYHAFLLVLKYGNRFGDDEVEVIKYLKEMFGADFVKDHCIILMTYGDIFKIQARKNRKSFKRWCEEQTGSFQNLIQECRGRIVLFDNMADGQERKDQIDILLGVVTAMGNRYTNDLFGKAAALREKNFVESKRPSIQMEVMERVTKISLGLNEEVVRYQNGDYDHKNRLEELCKDCDLLIEDVKKHDKSTGVLTPVQKMLLVVKESIKRTSALLDIGHKKLQQESDKSNATILALVWTDLQRQEQIRKMTEKFNNAQGTDRVREVTDAVIELKQAVGNIEKKMQENFAE